MKRLQPILIATILAFAVLGCGDGKLKQERQQVVETTESKPNPYAVYIKKVRSGEMTAEEAEVAFADEKGRPAGELAFQLWKQGLLN